MEIIALSPTNFSSNCYIIHNGKEALAVDPSINESTIIRELEKNSLTLKGILLTHGHFDHIWRAQELRDATGVKLYVHKDDAEMLTDPDKNAFRLFTGREFAIKEADVLLDHGDIISLGNEKITVIHTPGHTRGSVCYDTGDALFTGDTIFANSFGRCDLYGGDFATLKNSIARLCAMAEKEDRVIYPGHDDFSSLKNATKILKGYFRL